MTDENLPKVVLGGHIRSTMKLQDSISAAYGLGYKIIQIMINDSGNYAPREYSEETIQDFRTASYGLSVVVHLPYIFNPCEGSPQRRNFYKAFYRRYVKTCMALGVTSMVLHPGAKKDLPEPEAFKNCVEFLQDTHIDGMPLLLLETDAGSKNGSRIGSPEFIEAALKELTSDYAMCLDTTHMYARGYDLWNRGLREEFIDTYKHRIRLIHLNVPDENVSLGSFLDRHNSPFTSRSWDHVSMMNDFVDWPWVLERSSIQVQREDVSYIKKYFDVDN